jgi:hypothetical protein
MRRNFMGHNTCKNVELLQVLSDFLRLTQFVFVFISTILSGESLKAEKEHDRNWWQKCI